MICIDLHKECNFYLKMLKLIVLFVKVFIMYYNMEKK